MSASADFAHVLADAAGPATTVSLVLIDGTVRPAVRALVRELGNLPPLWLGESANRSAAWIECVVHVDALPAPETLKSVTFRNESWRVAALHARMGGGMPYAYRMACKCDQRIPGRA